MEYSICVAADCNGEKVNLQFRFSSYGPSVPQLLNRAAEAFKNVYRVQNIDRIFAVNAAVVFNDVHSMWDRLERSTQLLHNSQVYLFQPDVLDLPAEIPEPIDADPFLDTYVSPTTSRANSRSNSPRAPVPKKYQPRPHITYPSPAKARYVPEEAGAKHRAERVEVSTQPTSRSLEGGTPSYPPRSRSADAVRSTHQGASAVDHATAPDERDRDIDRWCTPADSGYRAARPTPRGLGVSNRDGHVGRTGSAAPAGGYASGAHRSPFTSAYHPDRSHEARSSSYGHPTARTYYPKYSSRLSTPSSRNSTGDNRPYGGYQRGRTYNTYSSAYQPSSVSASPSHHSLTSRHSDYDFFQRSYRGSTNNGYSIIRDERDRIEWIYQLPLDQMRDELHRETALMERSVSPTQYLD